MDSVFSALSFALLIAVVTCQWDEDEGPCFRFNGDGFLRFNPNSFNNYGWMHYRLKFRTNQENGVLLHSRGVDSRDFEILYIRRGRLHYQLYNTSPSGVEDYFGGHWVSNEIVNTGDWVTVNIYRISEVPQERGRSRRRKVRYQTGFDLKIGNGNVRKYVDYRWRNGISLRNAVYFGGYSRPLSDDGNDRFVGDIKDIREYKSNYVFEEPSLNLGGNVRICIQGPRPV